MSETCNHDCSSCKENCPTREKSSPADFLEKPHRMSRIRRVIGVVSGKGGVGKSMVTSLLAVLLRRRGFKSAVLDADVTGPSIPKAFHLTQKAEGGEDGIYPVLTKTGIPVMSINLLLEDDTQPVVWRGPILAGAVKQFWTDVVWGDVDIMFIDMPPGTGDVPLTVFQSIPVDGIVIVTTPQELVGMIVEKAVHMAGMMNIPVLALVENMSYVDCPDCGKRIYPFGESRLEETAKRLNIPHTARLPVDPRLAAACDAGKIELFEGNWLDGIADIVENKLQ
ncbi:MAG TPA: Mrp/NBP35 family ATP-binding protein [Clostridia bacterium]|nr:Mrp/NBP35 family ATP-binding protein [Clostridia bacterium]